jgi:hypothetical protein
MRETRAYVIHEREVDFCREIEATFDIFIAQ